MAGLREAQKLATRGKVLAAARELFVEIGYETATIRMIAERAGVATGSVFTTFPSKVSILRAVMDERLEKLFQELDAVAPHLRGPTVDRLCSILAVHYDFEMRRPKLFTAFLAANFDWPEGEPVITYGRQPRLNGILREVLEAGVANGDVRPDADLDLFIDVLLAAYGFNYRLAAQEGLGSGELSALMDRQIALIFDGVSARKS
ncbi:MAG: TetR/AcrR family transcriptional regulator [Alphaproteobacteria bacterium]